MPIGAALVSDEVAQTISYGDHGTTYGGNLLACSAALTFLTALVEGVNDERSPEKRKIFFLRRLPRDPMFTDPAAAPEDTWGLRSYVSEPDLPAEGSDVYDVYSKSHGTGLNGIAYAKW